MKYIPFIFLLALAIIGCAGNPHPNDDAIWNDPHPGQHIDDKGKLATDDKELATAKARAKELDLRLQQAQRDKEQKRLDDAKKAEAERARLALWTKRGGICFWIVMGSLVAFAVIRGIDVSKIPFTSPINPGLFLTVAMVGFFGNLYCMAAGDAEEHRGYIVAILGAGVLALSLRELHTTGGIHTFFGFNKKAGAV